jgi:hypothetical protein
VTTIEITHPGTPPKDAPEVVAAMKVWDNLTGRERREVFRTLYRSAVAYERSGDTRHMTRLAESVTGMCRLESNTNLRQILRSKNPTERT